MAKSPAIIEQTKRSGYFRARDVRANINELGFEKGLELSLTLLADELAGIRQAITEITTNQTQMIDVISNMTVISGEMAQRLETVQRMDQQFDSVRGSGA